MYETSLKKFRIVFKCVLILAVLVICSCMVNRANEFYKIFQELHLEDHEGEIRLWEDILSHMRYEDMWTTILVPLSFAYMTCVIEYVSNLKIFRYLTIIFYAIAQTMVVVCFTEWHYKSVEAQTFITTWAAFAVGIVYECCATTWNNRSEKNIPVKLRGIGLICATAHLCGMASVCWRMYFTYADFLNRMIEEPVVMEELINNMHPQHIKTMVVMWLNTTALMLAAEWRTQKRFLRYAAVLCYGIAQWTALVLMGHWDGAIIALQTCACSFLFLFMIFKGVRGAIPAFIITFSAYCVCFIMPFCYHVDGFWPLLKESFTHIAEFFGEQLNKLMHLMQ